MQRTTWPCWGGRSVSRIETRLGAWCVHLRLALMRACAPLPCPASTCIGKCCICRTRFVSSCRRRQGSAVSRENRSRVVACSEGSRMSVTSARWFTPRAGCSARIVCCLRLAPHPIVLSAFFPQRWLGTGVKALATCLRMDPAQYEWPLHYSVSHRCRCWSSLAAKPF